MAGDGDSIRPFNRQPICDKCQSRNVSMTYVRARFHEGEHLDVRCRECNFVWGMRTADG